MLRLNRKNVFGGVLAAVAALAVTFVPAAARASINLTQVQMTEDGRVDVMFDTKIVPGQIKTEYVNDNIQLSLTGVSVYPAKINSLTGTDLTKIFAYQYAPNLVRVRLTVRGKAQDYANRVQVKANGKLLSVRIMPETQAAAAPAAKKAASAAVPTRVVTEATSAQALASASLSGEERQLLDRVTNGDGEESANSRKAEKESRRGNEERGNRATRAKAQDSKALASGKPLASPMRAVGVMLFVLGLFGLFVLGLKKLKGAKDAKGIAGFLGKLGGNLGNAKLIDVVATHHLGPKKSIVMVRIQNRTLVLGMTNDNVNLITEFKSGADGEEESLDMGDFAEGLSRFESGNGRPVAKESGFGPLLGSLTGRSENSARVSRASSDAAPSGAGNPAQAASRGPKIDIDAITASLAQPQGSRPAARPATPARSATNAYAAAGSAPTAAGSAASAALEQAMRSEQASGQSAKPSLRDQIKNRVQGMKQL